MKYSLLVPTCYAYSGIDQAVLKRAADLTRQGNDVEIVTFDGHSDLPNVSLFRIGLPRNLLLQRMYRLFFFFFKNKINPLLLRLRTADVVESHFYPMSVIGLLAKKKLHKKFVYFDYGIPPAWTFSSPIEKIYISIFRFFSNTYARKADKIITISNYLAQEFQKQNKIVPEVELLTINTEVFKPTTGNEKIREKYHLPSAPIVLYVGRISPHKGALDLVQAFPIVKRTIPDACLVLVGNESFPQYKKRILNLKVPDVIFLGSVPPEDLPALYSLCSVYATATHWEGYNLPLVEAQACGKPVVAYNICSHPEVVKKGILVPENDIRAFANAIIQILKKDE